ncbi:UNVERIFIED_ORG: hypothetical protein M2438_002935 [Methylobacterium sp. SuP10 SLI 274]|uniref:hypothetical protein n=1 Tax=Methylorubrum extorquens TaxID=408 RepID=UPI00209EB8C9|nr:hypothetical protein [Methylorubrum extorquens]MCP1558845.1 hypothetical protein [Methylorubrum extorquens]MDF9792478.1 hypothetical protein [Methylorubrum extorquens]MDH6637760.1 hypothetical protein [Methylobacterium sp. SuP10 SLI 274]MDH6666939.1 hypothetical protein [Methylorubrum zatmanii]
MRWIDLAIVAASVLASGPSWAAGDFPLASCKGWNGTVVERDGIDTARALMRGIVTKADLQEYCERDPGGETKEFGGKLTKPQCVARYLRTESRTALTAEANCRTGTISYRSGERQAGKTRFPLGPDADTSCASGMPPLIAQFKMLCPAAVKRFRLE